MPKSNRKKTENFVLSQKTQNQTFLSRYFSPRVTDQSNVRKRGPSRFTTDANSKMLKLSPTSAESSDMENQLSFSTTDINCESDDNNKTISDISAISESSTSKLSSFSFNKRSKQSAKSSQLVHETSGNEQLCLLDKEIDAPKSHSDSEEMEQDICSEKKNIRYTPLEKQYLEFQTAYPDAVLLIECGYKYRFFGKDAKIAFNDLHIGCYSYHNFLSASIPTHRLNYHIRRLVLKGHKVAVIKQTESAALKAVGETRNELFSRKLYAMYTKSIFIDGELSVMNDERTVQVDDSCDDDGISGYLVCVNEVVSKKKSGGVDIACVTIQVSSGDMYYSLFQEGLIQGELEGFFACVNPSEILLPKSQLSKNTETLVEHFSSERHSRIERLDDRVFEHSFALNNMTTFISGQENASSVNTQEDLQILLSLPPLVISCLSALKTYLVDFKVENILRNVKNMQLFSTSDHMSLNAATMRGLAILRNNSDSSNYGTLFWFLNRTLTKFGERLLKSFIVKPLKDIRKIDERLNIVTEIIHSDSVIFRKISRLLYKLPDLEKLLCSAFYHKCTCHDFLKLVKALANIKNELAELRDQISSEIEVPKLRNILLGIVKYLDGIERFSSNIDPEAAKEGNKVKLFLDTSKYVLIETCKLNICDIEKKLYDLRPNICKILRLPAFAYSTVAGTKFLIEVPNSHLSLVPDDWLKISLTKQVSRFQSPEVIKLCKELDIEQAKLSEHSEKVWDQFLDEFGKNFYNYKHAVSDLSELDVYMTFAKISKDEKFCRPLIVDVDTCKFGIKQGRHPVIAKLMGEENQFVANDLNLNDTERVLIVTGPNMGGKSTYIRQIALIALMAHIGCFVPADEATIPLFDGIYVRLGADDDITNNKSTFMSEMSEASNILSSASSKSLVILDELGRGTSTNDGAAIAFATLEYFIKKVKCFTLFVTHYPTVMELKNFYPSNIVTVHMAYMLKDKDDDSGIQSVTFLYNVVNGVSEKSYGINVAALAGISKDILIEAQRKSNEMEKRMTIQSVLRRLLQKLKLTDEQTKECATV